jgi:recombination protein RecA
MTTELQKALANLRSKEGKEFGFQPKPDKFFSTNNLLLDHATGGGIPVGRIIELYGKSQSGKTTLALAIAEGLQRHGKVTLWLDFERAFDEPYARALGIDTSDETTWIYYKPTSLEDGADLAAALVRTDGVDLVVIDSIARMTTVKEQESSMEDTSVVAEKAKMLYKFTRMILNSLDDHDCSIIFLNHLLDSINTAMPGVRSTLTPGGNAVEYFSQLRLQCTKVKTIASTDPDSKGDAVDVEILVTKNRSAAPLKKVVLRNNFGSGFDNTKSAFDVVEKLGLVEKSGAWTYIRDEKLIKVLGVDKFNGFAKFIEAVEANPAAKETLYGLAEAALKGNSNLTSVVEDATIDETETLQEV